MAEHKIKSGISISESNRVDNNTIAALTQMSKEKLETEYSS